MGGEPPRAGRNRDKLGSLGTGRCVMEFRATYVPDPGLWAGVEAETVEQARELARRGAVTMGVILPFEPNEDSDWDVHEASPEEVAAREEDGLDLLDASRVEEAEQMFGPQPGAVPLSELDDFLRGMGLDPTQFDIDAEDEPAA